jgi:hypothetical protein
MAQPEVSIIEQYKTENKEAEGWLLWYEERKRKLEQRRADILLSVPIGPAGIPTTGNVSDNTGRRAAKLADLQRDEEWLRVVEEVEKRLPWKQLIFLRLRREYRYHRGRRGWTAAVQWRYAEAVAKRLGKDPEDTWVESRQAMNDWWRRIVEYTAREAFRRGLL